MSDVDLSGDFQRYLQGGERIVWTGQPAQGIRFSGQDIFLVPFSLVWTGIVASIFVPMASTGGQAMPFPFVLFPAIFLVAGIFFVFGRFLLDAWARSTMSYALTDRRALILRRFFGDRLIAISLLNCPNLRLSLRGERGDIDFESTPSLWFGRSWNMWTPSLGGAVRFIGIDDAQRVYELAQRPSRP
jgi:hypothetical protein